MNYGVRVIALITFYTFFMQVKATEILAAKESAVATAIEKNVCEKKSSHNELSVGALYRHYKGKLYKVKNIAYNSDADDLELWVVYEGLYTDPKLGPNQIGR